MSLTVEMKVKDFAALEPAIMHAFQNIDWKPAFEAAQQQIAADHRKGFDEEKDPAGTSWKPLAPRTIKRKGHAIRLFETGKLKGSLGPRPSENSIREITVGGPNFLLFGTDVEYAKYNQSGTVKIPARVHVGTTAEKVQVMSGPFLTAMVNTVMAAITQRVR